MRSRFAWVTIGTVSICASSLVAVVIHFNPKLMAHPNKLVYYMCLAEAIACYNSVVAQIGCEDFICYWGLDKIFHYTTFWQTT